MATGTSRTVSSQCAGGPLWARTFRPMFSEATTFRLVAERVFAVRLNDPGNT
jgi:uncharacterized protein involved in response to NO